MLIQPDKLRKLLIIVFSCLFLILAIQIRFDLLFMHVMDNGAELAVHNFVPQAVQTWINVASILNHYWLAILGTAGLATLFYIANYKIAMGWFIATQMIAMLVSEIVSAILQVHWDNGVQFGPMMPDLLLVWWFQVFAVIMVIFVPKLTPKRKLQWGLQGLAVILWCLIAMSRMQQNDMPLSSGLGALIFSYFWWQFSEQQYRKRAKHWRDVLKIDTSI